MIQPKMKIEVWTDIMCPYCYIGKKLYEKALQQFAHAGEVEVEWKAFLLNPDLPGDGHGYPVTDYLLNTVGMSEERLEDMFRNIDLLAADAGVKSNLRNAVAANTTDAHRLIKLASTIGKADFVITKLGKAYFEDAQDYSDHNLLIGIGTEAGLKEEQIRAMLAGDDYRYEIKQDIQEANNLGFDTVPTFLMDRRQAIVGSEPVDLYVKVLNKAYNNWKARTDKEPEMEVTKGKACAADGTCEI